MSSASYYPGARPPGGTGRRRLKASSPSRVLGIVLISCALGCLWVWKESLNQRLSSRLIALKEEEQSLRTAGSYLRRELMAQTTFTRIEKTAQSRLGMTAPQQAPDTIWTEEPQTRVRLGSVGLLKPVFPGIEL